MNSAEPPVNVQRRQREGGDEPSCSPDRPVLYVFFGLIATGKSTLARAWARRRGVAYYNSDVVRKELAGLAATAKQQDEEGRGIYTPEFTLRTYDELRRRAGYELRQGRSVVLDASCHQRAQRRRLVELAASLEAGLHFVLCRCSDEVKKQRLARRADDPAAVSDGRWEIYRRQRQKYQPPTEQPPSRLTTIDTDRPPEELLAELSRRLP